MQNKMYKTGELKGRVIFKILQKMNRIVGGVSLVNKCIKVYVTF